MVQLNVTLCVCPYSFSVFLKFTFVDLLQVYEDILSDSVQIEKIASVVIPVVAIDYSNHNKTQYSRE